MFVNVSAVISYGFLSIFNLGISAPQGVVSPQLQVLSDSSVRVTWSAPSKPNGRVTLYQLYLDNVRLSDVNSSIPGSHVIEGLVPYTVYTFYVSLLHGGTHSLSLQSYMPLGHIIRIIAEDLVTLAQGLYGIRVCE